MHHHNQGEPEGTGGDEAQKGPGLVSSMKNMSVEEDT